MERDDWRDIEAERLRRLRDSDRGDFGQADYSNLYGYDPRTRSGYKAYDDGRPSDDPRAPPEVRRYDDDVRRYRDDGPAGDRDHRRAARGTPSDRVLWAVIMERLDDQRRLDLRDVKVEVHDGEVTLFGTVRHKGDKRRIEDVADIDGVRNVQNNLRVRERSHWTFL
jgi:hypothetical protein